MLRKYKALLVFPILCIGVVFIFSFFNKKIFRSYVDPYLPLISQFIPIEDYFLSRDAYTQSSDIQNKYFFHKTKKYDLVFLGDSHFKRYDLERFYTGFNVANFGVSNDTTRGLSKRILLNHHLIAPRVVAIMVGYNDLRYRHRDEIVESYKHLLELVKQTYSIQTSNIVVLSLLPVSIERTYSNEQIIELNRRLLQLSMEAGAQYVDLFHLLIQPEAGALTKSYFEEDEVHLNEQGYQRITAALLPVFSKLLNGTQNVYKRN